MYNIQKWVTVSKSQSLLTFGTFWLLGQICALTKLTLTSKQNQSWRYNRLQENYALHQKHPALTIKGLLTAHLFSCYRSWKSTMSTTTQWILFCLTTHLNIINQNTPCHPYGPGIDHFLHQLESVEKKLKKHITFLRRLNTESKKFHYKFRFTYRFGSCGGICQCKRDWHEIYSD